MGLALLGRSFFKKSNIVYKEIPGERMVNEISASFQAYSPVSPNFYPDNFPIMWLFACLTVIAIPVSFRDINVQAFPMKSSRTRITAQKAASYRNKKICHSESQGCI